MELETRAIQELWHKRHALNCTSEARSMSGAVLRRLLDTVWWDEVMDQDQLLQLLYMDI